MEKTDLNFADTLSNFTREQRGISFPSFNMPRNVLLYETNMYSQSRSFYVRIRKNKTVPTLNVIDFLTKYSNMPKTHAAQFVTYLNETSRLESDTVLEIWPPKKIPYAYLQSNYAKSNSGPLGGSCMRHKDMQKALNFYVKNNAHIVVLRTSNNKILARALLWYNIHIERRKTTITFLDRIYYSSERDKPKYKELVDKEKWFSYNWNNTRHKYLLDIDLTDITHLPYADTFRYLYHKDKVLTDGSVSLPKIKHDKYLSLTTTADYGYHYALDKNAVEEMFTGNYISKKDGIFVAQYKAYVLKKHVVKIENTFYSLYDSKIQQIAEDEWALKENIVQEACSKVDIDKTKAQFIEKYDGYVLEKNIVKFNSDIYSKHDKNIIEYNKKYYFRRQCYNTKDGMMPKIKCCICYDLEEKDNEVLFSKPIYLPETKLDKCLIINTGEAIRNTEKNRQFLKKFNKNWYLKHLSEPINPKQLLFKDIYV